MVGRGREISYPASLYSDGDILTVRLPAPQGGARIKHLVAASGTLYAATDRGRIVRWVPGGGGEQTEIVIEKGGHDVIFRLHVDHTGSHLIVGGNQGDNWYVHLARGTRPRLMPMSKGSRVESVCWDRDGVDAMTTSEFLVGTSTGTICKACIHDGKDRYWKEIYSMQDSAQPICGIEYELFPPSGKNVVEGTRKYFVMAATPTRYYEFIGGPTFDDLFAQYSAAPNFVELPGDLDYTELGFFRKGTGRATSFVWLTGPGIYSGSLTFGSQNAGDSVTFDYNLMPYTHRGGGMMPVGLRSTEFHWLVLFEDGIQAINKLTQVGYLPLLEEICNGCSIVGRWRPKIEDWDPGDQGKTQIYAKRTHM